MVYITIKDYGTLFNKVSSQLYPPGKSHFMGKGISTAWLESTWSVWPVIHLPALVADQSSVTAACSQGSSDCRKNLNLLCLGWCRSPQMMLYGILGYSSSNVANISVEDPILRKFSGEISEPCAAHHCTLAPWCDIIHIRKNIRCVPSIAKP